MRDQCAARDLDHDEGELADLAEADSRSECTYGPYTKQAQSAPRDDALAEDERDDSREDDLPIRQHPSGIAECSLKS